MSFLLFILFILLLMVGIPLLRGWLYMQNVRRRVNESFRGRQQHERPSRERYEQEEEYTETGERKIFTSGEGEYADFEEVSGTVVEETASTGETRTIIEEQITDAEYEEIRE
ncbi:MAG: hypothetical protein IJV05_10270 [Muribaculaceae bacterium]|nr:hypothetical protein [Muribaculaceae bacterium]